MSEPKPNLKEVIEDATRSWVISLVTDLWAKMDRIEERLKKLEEEEE